MSHIDKRGYVLAELLVCVLISASLTLLTLGRTVDLDFAYRQFMNDFLKKQSASMAHKESAEVGYGLRINAMGHINQAKTLRFGKHWVIIHLGNGYLTYE